MFSEEYVKWMLTIHNFTKKRHYVMFGNHLVHTCETDGVEISSYCDELSVTFTGNGNSGRS